MENVTVSHGRKAVLKCEVDNLRNYKVSSVNCCVGIKRYKTFSKWLSYFQIEKAWDSAAMTKHPGLLCSPSETTVPNTRTTAKPQRGQCVQHYKNILSENYAHHMTKTLGLKTVLNIARTFYIWQQLHISQLDVIYYLSHESLGTFFSWVKRRKLKLWQTTTMIVLIMDIKLVASLGEPSHCYWWWWKQPCWCNWLGGQEDKCRKLVSKERIQGWANIWPEWWDHR